MNAFDIAYNAYADRIARNCSDNWIRKAYNICVKLWDATAEWADNYIFNPTAKLAQRILRKATKFHIKTKRDVKIEWRVPAVKGNCHYLVEFYTKDGKRLYSKSGKAENVAVRIKNELTKEYAPYGAYSAVVLRADFCGDDQTAADLELRYRVHLLDLHGRDNWLQNDRWMVEFDLADYDKFVKKFFKNA